MNTVYMYAVLNVLMPIDTNMSIYHDIWYMYRCDLNLYRYCITVIMYHDMAIYQYIVPFALHKYLKSDFVWLMLWLWLDYLMNRIIDKSTNVMLFIITHKWQNQGALGESATTKFCKCSHRNLVFHNRNVSC